MNPNVKYKALIDELRTVFDRHGMRLLESDGDAIWRVAHVDAYKVRFTPRRSGVHAG